MSHNTATATATRTQLAIQSYLDTLLQDAQIELADSVSAEEFEAAVREEQQRDSAKAKPAMQTALATPPVAVQVASPVLQAPVLKVAETIALPEVPLLDQAEWAVAAISAEPTVTDEAMVEVAVEDPVEPVAVIQPNRDVPPPPVVQSGPPAWGEEPFECLLFDVAGLTLAAPLVCLGSIYPLGDRELTPLFGQPDWFLGILPSQSGNLKVLDAARWVMPERYRDDFREGLQYVISVQGCEWGVAVHNVSHSVRLDPREVKWRSQRSQRPWLAGTVVEHMCALLDMAALSDLLASGAIRHAKGLAAIR
ncbi:chemotaxis protein CheW [Pseudomonas sp. Marseille-QA0892]